MLFRETSKSLVYLLLLLSLSPHGSAIGVSKPQTGTLVGGTLFVDKTEKKWLSEAAKVRIELEHDGQSIFLVSDELGDYFMELAAGTYCLKSARNTDGKQLRFAPGQHKCFKIEPDKDTRFDVMLLRSRSIEENTEGCQR